MKKHILLIITALQILPLNIYSQFTKSQIEELTAKGIYNAIESKNYSVLKKAHELTDNYTDKSYIQSVCNIFDYMYKNWNYQRDPGGMEYFEKAGVSVHTLTGDCDDYATLMVSLIKSLGGEARVVCVSGHAYPELYMGRDLSSSEIEAIQKKINAYYEDKGSRTRVRTLNYHYDSNGTQWLNLDYQDRYPGGDFVKYSLYAEHLVIYSDGSYELAYLNR